MTFVKVQSQLDQVPWISGDSTADIFFKPSNSKLADEHVVWQSVLFKPDIQSVSSFLFRHSVSRFANAARQWLDQNRAVAVAGLTRVSPYGPDLAWKELEGVRPAQITLKRFEGPLAFTRNIQKMDSKAGSIDVGEVLSSPKTPNTRASELATLFLKHGEAVVTGPISAVNRPLAGSSIVGELQAGTRLEVLGDESRSDRDAWLKVRVPGEVPRLHSTARNYRHRYD